MTNLHKLLYEECSYRNDPWISSIYGDPDNFEECEEWELQILLEINYCGISPKLNKYHCDSCLYNLKKIKYHYDLGYKIDEIVLMWNIDIEPDQIEKVRLNTIRDIPFVNVPVFTSNVIRYDDYNNKIPPKEDLERYSVIHFGWYFNQPLDFLLPYSNIKCIIFGHWFSQSLDVLESMDLNAIYVMNSYNRQITDKVYQITKKTSREIYDWK